MLQEHSAICILPGFCTGEVVKMMPIPKRLLIHEVELQTVGEKDSWGKESLTDPVMLNHVRLEPSAKYIRDKQNNEIQLAAVLIYDCKNSRPSGLNFADGQVIAFNSETYQVQMIEALYDGHRLHHYEVGVIRYAPD